jgi:hypothetical protein
MTIPVVTSETGNQTMKTTIATTAVVASLLLGASANAQDLSLANRTMDVGLSMLELSADMALEKYGYGDQDVMDLTLTQIAAIKAVTSGNDYGDNERRQQIGVILAH